MEQNLKYPHELNDPTSQGRLNSRQTDFLDLKDEKVKRDFANSEPSLSGSPAVYPLELKDDDGIFQQRYLRNTPIIIEPGRRNTAEGLCDSFTILFQHIYAFTFSMSESQEVLRAKEEARKKAAALAEQ